MPDMAALGSSRIANVLTGELGEGGLFDCEELGVFRVEREKEPMRRVLEVGALFRAPAAEDMVVVTEGVFEGEAVVEVGQLSSAWPLFPVSGLFCGWLLPLRNDVARRNALGRWGVGSTLPMAEGGFDATGENKRVANCGCDRVV